MGTRDRAGTNTVARALNDLGLAAWFGGSLMGAVGLNGASAAVSAPHERARVANRGWARWTPVNLLAIGAYAVGGIALTAGNKGRVGAQAGVATTAALKAALTGTAMAVTAYSRIQGEKVMQAGEPRVTGATEPAPDTVERVAAAQRKLKVLQWLVPALTGAAIVADARLGEQQRPTEVARGVLHRLNPAA